MLQRPQTPPPQTTATVVQKALAMSEQKAASNPEIQEMLLAGKKEYWEAIGRKTRNAKKDSILAEIEFTDEEIDAILKNGSPSLRAYVAYRKFIPSAEGSIHAEEHNDPIGKGIKGKPVSPSILTLSNIPSIELKLSDYGINLDQLLKDLKLDTLKVTAKLLKDPDTGEIIPDITVHNISGGDKKEVREREWAALQIIMHALLEKHDRLFLSGDGQDNPIEVSKDKKSLVAEKGRMKFTEAVKKFVDSLKNLRVKPQYPEFAKLKARGYRKNGVFQPSPWSNQQEKPEPDLDFKLFSMLVKKWQEGKASNRARLEQYTLPPASNLEHLATSNEVSDHPPTLQTDKKTGITKITSGGISLDGPKAIPDPQELLVPEAFELKDGNLVVKEEVLDAGVRFVKMLYKDMVYNLARVRLANPNEVPVVDTTAFPEPMSSLNHLLNYYKSLAEVGINPFKPALEIQFDFAKQEKITQLNTVLAEMKMDPINNSDEMQAIFASNDQDKIAKLCIALRHVGLDPFKSEEDMMASFDFTNDGNVAKLAKAINKFLQVQAIERSPLEDPEKIQAIFASKESSRIRKLYLDFVSAGIDPFKGAEEKMNDSDFTFTTNASIQKFEQAVAKLLRENTRPSEAALITDLRQIFTDTYNNFLESDQYRRDYFPIVKNPRHWQKGMVSAEMQKAHVQRQIEFFNAPSAGGSGRSPWNRLFQEGFGLELEGGFLTLAKSQSESNPTIRVRLLFENVALFVMARIEGFLKLTQSVTETSTKDLGLDPEALGYPKNTPLAAQLYVATAEKYEETFVRFQHRLQLQKKAEKANEAEAAPPATPVASPRASTSSNLSQSPHSSFPPPSPRSPRVPVAQAQAATQAHPAADQGHHAADPGQPVVKSQRMVL